MSSLTPLLYLLPVIVCALVWAGVAVALLVDRRVTRQAHTDHDSDPGEVGQLGARDLSS